ncbi:MAG: HAD-IA family hydrolase, partial [bacterium]
EILKAFIPQKGMPELVRRLLSEAQVALLTDQTNWLYELDERDDLFAQFDEVISSYEEGFSKRDLEIFRIACERCNILPAEGIFFDDNPENVRRATEFGLTAHIFEQARMTEDILISDGVIGIANVGSE